MDLLKHRQTLRRALEKLSDKLIWFHSGLYGGMLLYVELRKESWMLLMLSMCGAKPGLYTVEPFLERNSSIMLMLLTVNESQISHQLALFNIMLTGAY